MTNAALQTDFYKTGHIFMYPKNVDYVYSNFTCRSAKHAKMLPDYDNKVVFFGLQSLIKRVLICDWDTNFFNRELEVVVDTYKEIMDKALGEGTVTVDHITNLWELGYLPIEIKALPEGSRVNIGIPLLTITNTVREFAWLVNYLESAISAELWPSVTAATVAYEFRRLLDKYATITGTPLEFVPWQGHDFSMRGLMGTYASEHLVGPAHLTSFTGTDTVSAISSLEENYHASNCFVGGSVPATEHSVASANIMLIESMLAQTGEWNGFKVENL